MAKCELQTSGMKIIPAANGTLKISILPDNRESAFCDHAEQSILFRLVSAVSEPILLNKVIVQECKGNRFISALSDGSGNYKASLTIESESNRFKCRLEGHGVHPGDGGREGHFPEQHVHTERREPSTPFRPDSADSVPHGLRIRIFEILDFVKLDAVSALTREAENRVFVVEGFECFHHDHEALDFDIDDLLAGLCRGIPGFGS